MAEVYMIDDSLIAEHAEGMLGRELTAQELRFAIKDVRRQMDSNIQDFLEIAILYAVRQQPPNPSGPDLDGKVR